jgi:hypothetical protein
MILVAVREEHRIDLRQFLSVQGRRHLTVEVESVLLADRLAGVREIRIDRHHLATGTLREESGLP